MDDAGAIDDLGDRERGARRGPRVRGPVDRRADRHPDRPTDERAEALKERVYATFTGLAIVLVQLNNAEHLLASNATYALLIGIVGITVAGFAADVIAHMSVHAAFPTGDDIARMLRIAGSALASAVVPLVLLVLAWTDVLDLERALRTASIVYLATLGVIGYFAVRRTRLGFWQQLVALAILVALGGLVILLQQLAHEH
jgi:cytochrome b subunit of formate dehydrogenase